MRMLKHFWLAGLLLAVTGCGAGLQGEGYLSAGIDSPAGFEIVDSGENLEIEIHTNEVIFRNQAGAPRAQVHSYEAQVFDTSGNLVAEADSIAMKGAFQVPVPPGKRCKEEGAEGDCPAPGDWILVDSYSEPRPLVLIASFVPTYMLENDVHLAWLRITFRYQQGSVHNRAVSVEIPVVQPIGGNG